MLQTIQIIALLQGLFLLLVLVKRKREYERVNFWLLLSSILAVMLYAIGDDDHNLIVADANWYVFHDILLLSIFFLFIKYNSSNIKVFNKRDLLYFIPYLAYVALQFFEDVLPERISKIGVVCIGLTLLVYLALIIRMILKANKDHWMLYFIIPYAIIFAIDHGADLIYDTYDSIPFLESYGIIGLSVLLVYVILFKIITSPKSVIPKSNITKYKTSSFDQTQVTQRKQQLIALFEKDKIFKDSKLSVNDVAKAMDIPRQHLSEILNVHMQTNFQEFLSAYRVKEFIVCLHEEQYKNFSLLGIAYEVGFNSKTSFYTSFKKIKGMTPNAYRNQLKTE